MAATGVISPVSPHHQIKQRTLRTSHCSFTFFPTTSHCRHHHHHALYSQLPTAPKCHSPSSSSSDSDSMAFFATSPLPLPKTEEMPSTSSTTAGRSLEHFLKLIRRTVDAGNYDRAFYLLERLVSDGHRPEVVPCTKLIQGLSSSHSVRKAERVMEILELRGSLDIVAYNALLTGLCRCNQVDTALSFLPRMRRRNCPPNNITYNILLGDLCFRGRLDDALDLFHSMLEDDLSQPCVVTYTILVEAHISEDGVAEAVRLLEDMLARGLAPNSYTFRAIVRGLCREGLVDQAWQLLRQQQSSGSDPDSAFPDVGSYNILLRGLLQKRRWRDAGALVAEMFADGRLEPDVLTHRLLVFSFCQEGMVENAVSLLDDMVRQGLKPTSVSINPVIAAYCRQRRVGLAVAFLERMVAAGCVPSLVNYNNILGGLCKNGMAREAAGLLQELERAGYKPNTCSYNTVVGGLWARGERQMAVELVGEMVTSGMVANDVTYNMLVSCLCRDRMVDEAMELVGIMEVAGLRPSAITYNAVLLGLCKMRREVEAVEVFVSKMTRMGASISRKGGGNAGAGRIARPNDATYEILVEGIACGGHRAEAAELANALITSNMISEKSKWRIRVLSAPAPSSSASPL